ncbi:alpha/beta-hydrolase [Aureobasidium sp. EXF-12298]|nr:alpha/beta-hydrolase [Aureobasidium sp. EXF-12298]
MHFATILTTVLLSRWSGVSDAHSDGYPSTNYEVASLPDAPALPSAIHAGLMPVSPLQNTSLFFWHFASALPESADKTFLWFNGGPGCSSSTGAMLEIGPYRMQSNGTLTYNEGSWAEYGNLLFIDNPIGTGYSFAPPDLFATELDEAARSIIAFLENFFDLYLAGESFAGQYIPHIAQAIQLRNRKRARNWNLSGLIIGNGWIDGQSQYPAYMEYAIANDLVPKNSLETIRHKQEACLEVLANGGRDHVRSPKCSDLMGDILMLSQKNGNCFNMYDVRKWDEFPRCGMNYPPGQESLATYMQREDVMETLHVNPKSGHWEECRPDVGAAFTDRNSLPSSRLLPELISDMSVLLYAGDRDFACNHLGLETFIQKLEWNGTATLQIKDSSHAAWMIEDRVLGEWYSAHNLTYVRYYNASHMVPYDHPREVKQMLHRYLGASARTVGDISVNHVDSMFTVHPGQERHTPHWGWILFGISATAAGFMLAIMMIEASSISW